MKLHTINTELFKLDGGAMFGVVPKTIWEKKYPADDKNLCVWAMRCLLVEDEGRLILIDTGIGNKQSEKFFSYYDLHGNDTLEKSILQLGYAFEDITDVLLTHLHFDHVGGAVKRDGDNLVPTFSKAIYWSNQSHYHEATVTPNDREKASFFKENIIPLQESGQLQFIEEKQGVRFSKHITVRFAYGHTKALMMPVIEYKNYTLVYVADMFPCAGHLPIPYVAGYDVHPLISMQEKRVFLNEFVQKNTVLFFEHDPYIECCTLQQTEKGVQMKESFLLSSIL